MHLLLFKRKRGAVQEQELNIVLLFSMPNSIVLYRKRYDAFVTFLLPDEEYGSRRMHGQAVEIQMSLSGDWELSKP